MNLVSYFPLDDEVGLGKALLHIALADGIDGLRKDVVGTAHGPQGRRA